MVFSSHLFLFYFLPLALGLYYASPRSLRMPVLTLTSYVFYGWTNPWFVLLIAWSTLVDFTVGNLIHGHWRLFRLGGQRKFFLGISLLSNLAMLCFFKYFMFAEENLNRLLAALGKPEVQVLTVLLPAGISFYTFESISYVLDIYYGRALPASVWVERLEGSAPGLGAKLRRELRALNAFACYITQFPHLVAGPIIRYQDLERQLHERTHSIDKFGRGAFIFILGLSKKVLLANPMGEMADAAFEAGSLHGLDAWSGLLGYAFQIYFDFSGYSDMAVGLGLLFGFEFAKNFDSPYRAESLTEFWRRWHISLSTWLRDYLYIPLGGNRKGEVRTYGNLIVVMLLGGFWHGASWNFLVWGAIHGAGLAVERRLGKASFYAQAPKALRVLLTFLVVTLAWVFFRADDLPRAVQYLATLFGGTDAPPTAFLVRSVLYSTDHRLAFAACAGIAFFGAQTWDLSKRVTPLRAAGALGLFVWSLVALSTQSFNPFLYFQF
ncbi:MAG TPA: MBOAT family protein [Planctomycetota bacterium]|nr:MBOAT family protein [Planctomycetota bacterium]